MKKIIFDTDIGIDDAFGVAYAVKHFDVVGITTVFGNCTVSQATKNAKLFADRLGLDIKKVYRGASKPLLGESIKPATEIHGVDGLGDVLENNFDDQASDAVSFIIDTIRKNPGEITIVAVGPYTNLAIALILAPDIADKIKEVVVMGGAFGTDEIKGNVTPFAENNIYSDSHAADLVFNASWNVTVIPLDVTHKIALTRKEIESTRNSDLIAISDVYLKFYMDAVNFDGMIVHDALTISYIKNPELFHCENKEIRVSLEGITLGQTLTSISDVGFMENPFNSSPKNRVCLGVDVEKVKVNLIDSLSNKKR